jgi:hypothetical protein
MLTADQLAAALTDEKLDDAVQDALGPTGRFSHMDTSALRHHILQALQPLLTGTCQTCRHWHLEEYQVAWGLCAHNGDDDREPPRWQMVENGAIAAPWQGASGACFHTCKDFACNRYQPREDT